MGMSMASDKVAAVVREQMAELGVPGVALGVLHDGKTEFAGFGVTNVENPLPVDDTTLFRVASISKTFTATAVLRLVEQGKLDLDAPLRRYLPELRLADPDATERATLRHCLNHYGGWTGDVFDDFGRGDDALARYAEHMAQVPQLTRLGTVWSYNNAGFCLAGRAVEVATGQPFEQAVRELLLDPLGMDRTFYFAEEMATHRLAVGHTALDDGPHVTRPWTLPRAGNAMGGLVSCVRDLFTWARFQMGDGAGLLRRETLDHAQGALAPAGAMADWIGVAWQSLDVGGTRVVQHGGSWLNQLSTFRMVPERGFAVVVLTNGHRGAELHGAVGGAALREYLGLAPQRDPLPAMDEAALRPYVGRYDAVLTDVELSLREGGLVLNVVRRADLMGARPEAPWPPPVRVAFEGPDKLFAQDPPYKGTKGDFLRDDEGQIVWFRWGGRIHRRR
jgi:CubicO group peptidase (beta-lactamase class C family)